MSVRHGPVGLAERNVGRSRIGRQPPSIDREQPGTPVVKLVKSRLGVFQDVLNLVRTTQFGASPNKLSAYPHRRGAAPGRLFEATLSCVFRSRNETTNPPKLASLQVKGLKLPPNG